MSNSTLEPDHPDDDDGGYPTLGAAVFVALKLETAFRRLLLLSKGREEAPEATSRDYDDAENFRRLAYLIYMGTGGRNDETVEQAIDGLPDEQRLEARVLIEHYFV